MAMAFRPRPSPCSSSSRHGSQALVTRSRLPVGSEIGGPKSVVTSLAGFAGARRPQPPGVRTPIPAALRQAPAVSRRTPVACSLRRSGHPSFPSAITCCFFSSLKTLLMLTEAIGPLVRVNFPGFIVGRFSGDPHWPVLGDH
jgi:hypothetical protein